MHNFWIIAKHEYRNRVGKRSFLLGTFGVPFLILIAMGVSIFVALGGVNSKPLGYVDHSGLIKGEVVLPRDQQDYGVEIQAFPDEASAQSALEQQKIQAYYVIDQGYLQNRVINMYYWNSPPSDSARVDFSRFLRTSLVSSLPQNIQPRLIDPPSLTVQSMDGSRELGSENIVNFLIPFIAGFLFFFVVMGSAGYMLQVVADEKENRTVEILITSLSPEQLIGGKAVGLMGVALTQLAIWLTAIVVGLLIGRNYWEPLRSVQVPWDYLLVVALFFLPAFALMAGIMTAIGGIVTETRQGQQIAGLLNMLFILPVFFTATALINPNSPLMIAMTLFPTTAFVTVSMRWGATVIPFSQIGLSWVILVLSTVFSVWAAARIFRLGMLRYGQQLSLRSALGALRSQAQE